MLSNKSMLSMFAAKYALSASVITGLRIVPLDLKSRHRDPVFGMVVFSICAGCQCKSSIMYKPPGATNGNNVARAICWWWDAWLPSSTMMSKGVATERAILRRSARECQATSGIDAVRSPPFQMKCLTRGETREGQSLRTYRDPVLQYPPRDCGQSICRTPRASVDCQAASPL